MPYVTSTIAGVDLFAAIAQPSIAVGRNSFSELPSFAAGQQVETTDDSVFIYCKAAEAITGRGYACIMDEAFDAVMLTSATAVFDGKVGVPLVAAAAGQYFWLQVFGTCDQLRAGASCAANVPLYTTDVAGVLDDAATGYLVEGVVLTTARAASEGNAPAVLTWPVIGEATALVIAGDDTLALTVNVLMTPEVYSATGGVPPYVFTVSVGTLPVGLALAAGGTLTGTPTVIAVTNVTIKVTDAALATDTLPVEITVAA